MDTTNRLMEQFWIRWQQFAARSWYILRNPKLTAGLLLAVGLAVVLQPLLPQQAGPDTGVSAWVALLPAWIQPWGELLYMAGMSRIFQSTWFWLVLALLLLNSLLALADYTPPAWQRAQTTGSDANALEWQHPLARRIKHSMRLPEAPDEWLAALKEKLTERGFRVDAPNRENERLVSASRRRWSWLSVVVFYGGVVLLCVAFVISHFWLKSERLTLYPQRTTSSQLLDGFLALESINANNRWGALVFSPNNEQLAGNRLTWGLYRPAFLGDTLVVPLAINPMLTIEARDASGELRRLMPLQEELGPDTRLNLPLNSTNSPYYFLIPSASLAFQILPVALPNQNNFNVQVRRGSEASPSENLMVSLNETFEVDGLSVAITLGHNVELMVRRDFALPFYVLSGVMMVVGGALLYLWPPWQVWLVPEVKGRGGQLYGVVETLGPTGRASKFLEQLLVNTPPPSESTAGDAATAQG